MTEDQIRVLIRGLGNHFAPGRITGSAFYANTYWPEAETPSTTSGRNPERSYTASLWIRINDRPARSRFDDETRNFEGRGPSVSEAITDLENKLRIHFNPISDVEPIEYNTGTDAVDEGERDRISGEPAITAAPGNLTAGLGTVRWRTGEAVSPSGIISSYYLGSDPLAVPNIPTGSSQSPDIAEGDWGDISD